MVNELCRRAANGRSRRRENQPGTTLLYGLTKAFLLFLKRLVKRFHLWRFVTGLRATGGRQVSTARGSGWPSSFEARAVVLEHSHPLPRAVLTCPNIPRLRFRR